MGTAVQNNPKAQKDVTTISFFCSSFRFIISFVLILTPPVKFLDVEGLPVLLTALQNDSDPEVRAKCMTCLSGLVRHNPEAFKLLRASSSSSSTTSNLGLEPVLGLLTQTTNGNWSKAQKRAVFFLDGLISGSSGEEVGVIEKAVEDAKKNDWAGSVVSLLLKDDHLDSDLIEKVGVCGCVCFYYGFWF
ncbi:hypothetical protein BDR26DRAFT_858917 [Obelidium mucronatum]|nr:hypothetical protein BDR26DRAFT_858917 [Obelidium mucronatum]